MSLTIFPCQVCMDVKTFSNDDSAKKTIHNNNTAQALNVQMKLEHILIYAISANTLSYSHFIH